MTTSLNRQKPVAALVLLLYSCGSSSFSGHEKTAAIPERENSADARIAAADETERENPAAAPFVEARASGDQDDSSAFDSATSSEDSDVANSGGRQTNEQGQDLEVSQTIPAILLCTTLFAWQSGTGLKWANDLIFKLYDRKGGQRDPIVLEMDGAAAKKQLINQKSLELPLTKVADGEYDLVVYDKSFSHCDPAKELASAETANRLSWSNSATTTDRNAKPSPLANETVFNQFTQAFSDHSITRGTVAISKPLKVKNGKLVGPAPQIFVMYKDSPTITIRPEHINPRSNSCTLAPVVDFYKLYDSKAFMRQVSNDQIDQCDGISSPLIIDMTGHGIKLSPPLEGVRFDIDASGTPAQISWPQSDAAFLVLDRNRNGKIDNGAELFGDHTPSRSGDKLPSNGFIALAQFDDNQDGVIDENDSIFGRLGLWFDRNRNGRTDVGELISLRVTEIKRIPVKYDDTAEGDAFGNIFGQRAKVETKRGGQLPIIDVWFRKL